MQKKYKVNKNKNICFINQDLAGFEPTGKCLIDVLVKTISTPQLLIYRINIPLSRRLVFKGHYFS